MLVIEDERKISAYVKGGPEEQGHAGNAAFTGREALDWATAVEFDLIVLDILLPEMDGLAVCRELCRIGVHTPILMLSARDAVDDQVAGLDAGADNCLVNPLRSESCWPACTRSPVDATMRLNPLCGKSPILHSIPSRAGSYAQAKPST